MNARKEGDTESPESAVLRSDPDDSSSEWSGPGQGASLAQLMGPSGMLWVTLRIPRGRCVAHKGLSGVFDKGDDKNEGQK